MNESEKLGQIREKALELGAAEAKVIPADAIMVEHRVVLKCRIGCDEYGRTLTCPPHTIPVDEFRQMLAEYRWAMLLKFHSEAHAGCDVATSLLRTEYDEAVSQKRKADAAQFWTTWKSQKKDILLVVLELEKTAFNLGFTFALAFTSGSCGLCQQCHPERGICVHPSMARLPEHAVGINMKQTVANAGMPLSFPFQGHPEPTALLFID
jgi:predicted metal-binding protein